MTTEEARRFVEDMMNKSIIQEAPVDLSSQTRPSEPRRIERRKKERREKKKAEKGEKRTKKKR